MSDWTMTWMAPAAWDVSRGRVLERVPLDPNAWAAAPARFGTESARRYRELAGLGDFGAWWRDAVGGDAPGAIRFLIDADHGHWERAWEAAVGILPQRRREQVSIIRRVGGAGLAPHRIAPGEPLRVVVLQGAASGPKLHALDLAAEFRGLVASYEDLDAAARQVVARPVAFPADRTGLAGLLTEARPGVLWLSGHAGANPPGFLLSDGTWLSPAELAAAVRSAGATSGNVPLYVVLWACRSAAPARLGAPGAAPPFVEALCREGVAAVMGAMAPLADEAAIPAARTIFEGLAGGRPLDQAAARARAELLRAQEANGRDDWACLVVWCADLPPPAVQWGKAGGAPVARQSLARRLLPDGWEPPDADTAAMAQGTSWARSHRVCVVSPAARSASARDVWACRLLATQKAVSRHVLAIDFSGLTASAAIRNWAARVLGRTDHLDDPDRWLRTIAKLADSSPEECWSALCRSDMLTLGLLDLPGDADWLARGLNCAAASVILLATSVPATGEWKPDRIMNSTAAAPEGMLVDPLAQAMAVLAAPADRGDIEQAVGVLPSWFSDATVRVRDGMMMQLQAAEQAAEATALEARAQAHRLAFHLLDGPRARARLREERAEQLRKARMLHAREASLSDEALWCSADLMDLYSQERRPAAFLATLEDVRGKIRQLTEEDEGWRVSAGWAHLATGRIAEALAWLRSVDRDRLAPEADSNRLVLMAEAEKASGTQGSKDRARALLREAAGLVADPANEAEERASLIARGDLTWLAHVLDDAPAAALPEYKAIALKWAALTGSGLQRAIVLRNMAEARMALAASGLGADQLERAASDLDDARDALPAGTAHQVASELEYVRGRLGLRRVEPMAEVEEQFRRCVRVALDTNHLMMAAIAEARLFWINVTSAPSGSSFDPGAWRARAEALQPYRRHALAARVLVDGHLRAARRLHDHDERTPALRFAEDALGILKGNPAFDRGDDLRRRLEAHAALALLHRRGDAWWDELMSADKAAMGWVAAEGLAGPGPAWAAARRG